MSKSVVFDEEACWLWENSEHGERVHVFQGHEGIEDEEEELSREEEIQVTNKATPHEQRHSIEGEEVEEQPNPVKYKFLRDIYRSCFYFKYFRS